MRRFFIAGLILNKRTPITPIQYISKNQHRRQPRVMIGGCIYIHMLAILHARGINLVGLVRHIALVNRLTTGLSPSH